MLKKLINILQLIAISLLPTTAFSNVTVIHNIKGYSINDGHLVSFQAIAFKDSKVLTIGDSMEILNQYPDSKKIDGNGETLLPGLHDSHGHVLPLAKKNRELSLKKASSLEQAIKLIEAYAKKSKRKWVVSSDWNFSSWKQDKRPSKQDLDKIKTNKAIWIKSIDGNFGWANTMAIQTAKLNNPKFKKELLSNNSLKESSENTGIFENNNMSFINGATVNNVFFSSEGELFNTLKKLSSLGITSVNDMNIDWRTYHTYKRLRRGQKLPIRVNATLFSGAKKYSEMIELGKIEDPREIFQVNTVSYTLDQLLLTHGAALKKPYNDKSNNSGKILQSKDFIIEQIRLNNNKKWNISISATGDKAVETALDIFSTADLNIEDLRVKIEHAKIIDLNDINKFNSNNIIASIQPISTTADMSYAQDRVGRERLRGGYAWQTLNKKGALLISGSDFPYNSANPFYGIHAAVTRQDQNNQPKNGWIPIERLTVEQALASYTINAAYANHQEHTLGSLEPNKWADFILIDQDIFTIEASEIWKTKVSQTWVAGKKIYQKKIKKIKQQ